VPSSRAEGADLARRAGALADQAVAASGRDRDRTRALRKVAGHLHALDVELADPSLSGEALQVVAKALAAGLDVFARPDIHGLARLQDRVDLLLDHVEHHSGLRRGLAPGRDRHRGGVRVREPPAPAPGRAGRLAIDGPPGPHAESLLYQDRGAGEEREVGRAQVGKTRGDEVDPVGAGAVQQPPALRGGFDQHGASVRRRRPPSHKPLGGQTVHDARHRGGSDSLGAGEIAQRQRATKYHHGQGGEPRPAEATGSVLFGRPPQQVDGRGMQTVCNVIDLTRHR
jgi:hypothetical protein